MRALAQWLVLAGLGAGLAAGQTNPGWRKVGGASVELMLAAPATGPVEAAWFSLDGGSLFVRVRAGKTFETADFETWTETAAAESAAPVAALADRLPDPGARVVATAADPARLYALGRQLYRSLDGGKSWINLTAYQSESVVGAGQHALAVSPRDPDELVVANDYGVWRSLDGGLSWSGLNGGLPNLPVRRILAAPTGAAGARIQAEGLGVLELPPGGAVWLPVAGRGGGRRRRTPAPHFSRGGSRRHRRRFLGRNGLCRRLRRTHLGLL